MRKAVIAALVIVGVWLAWSLRQRLQQPPLVETATVVRDDVSRLLAVLLTLFSSLFVAHSSPSV